MRKINKKLNASLTVEAAFVGPLTFFALVCFCWFFILLHTQFSVYQGLLGVSDTLYDAGTLGAYIDNSNIVTDCIEAAKGDVPEYIESLTTDIVSFAGGKISHLLTEKMLSSELSEQNRTLSCVKNENAGIDMSGTRVYGGSSEIELTADYVFEFPFSLFGAADIEIMQRMSLKGFYGDAWEKTSEFADKEREEDENPPEQTVYITDSGSVYHLDSNCTYISVKLTEVPLEEISALRNYKGGIYYPCEYCCDEFPEPYVYITEYGDRYHNDKNCSRVERNVRSVTITEAENMGRRACSKCGGE